MSFLDGRKSNKLNCCSGCAVEVPLRFNISKGERSGKGFLLQCRLLARARHDLLLFELARDGGDMHRIAAEARILAEVGFHPLFNFGIVQSLDARSKRLLQFLSVEIVREFLRPRSRGVSATGSAGMIGNSSNHNPHDECKRWRDGSAGGATFTGGVRPLDVAAQQRGAATSFAFVAGREQSLSSLEQARGSESDAEKAKVFVR